ncbi:MAG: PQQ-dependent sugar dehydrogenase [Acidobacteriota bacterium]
MVSLVLASVLAAAPWPRVALTRVAGGFSSPTQVTSARDGSGRLFVVEQRGLVKIVKDGVVLPTPYLDVRDRVSCCVERGLLSIAFPPGPSPKLLYIDYTDVNGDTAIWRCASVPDSAGPVTETLKIAQPFANHNGGQLAFGPDGYLYVGMGDGGSAGDPNNNAQNLRSLLGKILRIDVRGSASPYGIPPSNPFAGSSSFSSLPEIWAYGLRNPWRFSFDRKTGDLFTGDVGQGAWEEVDVQPAGFAGGANYGWRVTEGAHCYNPATGCSFAGITLPVAEYGHGGGNCSITGGFVYRGRDFARLNGMYFYADYCSGRLWGLRDGPSGWETHELLKPGYAFTSFGEDDDGEIYAVDGTSGTLYRLVDADGPLSVLTVPVVVDASGVNGARFLSELTLGNRGTTDASVVVTFTASNALGSTGSGSLLTTVPAGRQLVYTDVFQWLRQNGLFIPLGDQGGTLRLAFSGLSSGDAGFASVRTLAVLPSGRAGLSYPAIGPNDLLDAPVAFYGLRENAALRTNLALINAGDPATGNPLTLRVTVFSGDAGDGRNVTLAAVSLAPGQWMQLNHVLASAGFTNGWATVERVSGTDPFYAYAVVNDNVTGDGAFVSPVAADRRTSVLTIPAVVETPSYSTELVLTNPTSALLLLRVEYNDRLGARLGEGYASQELTLTAFEQRILPSVLVSLRAAAPGATSAGSLRVRTRTGLLGDFNTGPPAAFFAGARTSSASAGAGTFGVSYAGITRDDAPLAEAWVYGLKQDGLNRSNLALAIVDPPLGGPSNNSAPSRFAVDFFDGDFGLLRGSSVVSLYDRLSDWQQLNSALASFGIRNGYVRVRAPAGNYQPFLVYGVVNDGAAPGQGTGDGSYLGMSPVK